MQQEGNLLFCQQTRNTDNTHHGTMINKELQISQETSTKGTRVFATALSTQTENLRIIYRFTGMPKKNLVLRTYIPYCVRPKDMVCLEKHATEVQSQEIKEIYFPAITLRSNPKVTEDHILSSLREEIIFDFDFIYLMYFS